MITTQGELLAKQALVGNDPSAGWVQRANAWAEMKTRERSRDLRGVGDGLVQTGVGQQELALETFAINERKWMLSTPDTSSDLDIVPMQESGWNLNNKTTIGADGSLRTKSVRAQSLTASKDLCVGTSCIDENRLRTLGQAPAAVQIPDPLVAGYFTTKGGISEYNPGRAMTHLPWTGDNKNYIRGDTEIAGNTNNIGNMNVGRNMNIQGKMFFGDPVMGLGPNATNSSDPYYIEKVVSSGNNSSLRVTINDDWNESMEIWGNSCGTGNCGGPGTMQHKFQANGDAEHKGTIKAGMLCIGKTCLDEAAISQLTAVGGGTTVAATIANEMQPNIGNGWNISRSVALSGRRLMISMSVSGWIGPCPFKAGGYGTLQWTLTMTDSAGRTHTPLTLKKYYNLNCNHERVSGQIVWNPPSAITITGWKVTCTGYTDVNDYLNLTIFEI